MCWYRYVARMVSRNSWLRCTWPFVVDTEFQSMLGMLKSPTISRCEGFVLATDLIALHNFLLLTSGDDGLLYIQPI